MSAVVIDPSLVALPNGNHVIRDEITVAEAVLQGQVGYSSGNNEYSLANNVALASAAAGCLFLLPSAADGKTIILLRGHVILGATSALSVGTAYYLSGVDGGIFQESDLVANMFSTFLGIAISTAILDFQPIPTGIQIP